MMNIKTTNTTSHFLAHISRLKLIYRWPLMRNVNRENVQEHSHQVAVVGHCLGVINNQLFDGDVRADKIATAGLFHDASEVLTGDLPTPVKYFNTEIATAYKEIERIAEQKLLSMVPPELQQIYQPILTQEALTQTEKKLAKAADTLCAYIKTLEELHAGNHEFMVAKKRLEKTLLDNEQPEVKYFLETFIPSYSLSLDEISMNDPVEDPPVNEKMK
jgi:5'-deoxynucleotidase